jgi:hypothetical protein
LVLVPRLVVVVTVYVFPLTVVRIVTVLPSAWPPCADTNVGVHGLDAANAGAAIVVAMTGVAHVTPLTRVLREGVRLGASGLVMWNSVRAEPGYVRRIHKSDSHSPKKGRRSPPEVSIRDHPVVK